MVPAGFEADKIPRIFIAASAFQRLKMYIDLCPFEVGGLGTVEPYGEDLLVTDLFLIRQRASDSDMVLDPQAVAECLLQTLQERGDLAAVRVWWHSHGRGPVFWSKADDETIEALQVNQLLSIVGNKQHEFGCRLDHFWPTRLTLDHLPLLPLPEGLPEDAETLRREVLTELRQKVNLVWRNLSLEPELLFNPSSVQEIPLPFPDEEKPP